MVNGHPHTSITFMNDVGLSYLNILCDGRGGPGQTCHGKDLRNSQITWTYVGIKIRQLICSYTQRFELLCILFLKVKVEQFDLREFSKYLRLIVPPNRSHSGHIRILQIIFLIAVPPKRSQADTFGLSKYFFLIVVPPKRPQADTLGLSKYFF